MLTNAVSKARGILQGIASLQFNLSLLGLSLGPRSRFAVSRGGGCMLSIGRVRTADNVRISLVSGKLTIGDGVFFNRNCTLVCRHEIFIGKGTLFGPGVAIYDHNHQFGGLEGVSPSEYSVKPISIGENCWIGANAIILAGAVLGDRCVVGAGCVISGEVPPDTVVFSNRELIIKSHANPKLQTGLT